MEHDRSRYIRITLLKTLFLVGIIANLMFLPSFQLIPRPLDENSLSALSYESNGIDRFIPVTIFEYYHPKKILIQQDVMSQLQLDVNELHRIARIDTVQIISQDHKVEFKVPGNESIIERTEYPLDEKLKVVFLRTAPGKDAVTVGAIVQGDTILFFPIENE